MVVLPMRLLAPICLLLFAGEMTQAQQNNPGRLVGDAAPNILTVFVDDMGWSDVSLFGGDAVVTQNIDRLAAEGLRFTQFYVNSPICSPSRVALTTGQYPQRWRISSFLNHRTNNTERGMAQWLDPKAPVLARQLQHKGYATGHFGKWHMGGQRDVDDAPPISQYGFDRSLTNFEGMGPKLLPLTWQPGWEEAKPIWADAVRLGEPVTWRDRSQITQGFVDAAIEFIDKSQAAGQPFYVNVWPDDVHSPFFPPLNRWGNNKRELYNGVLDTMDEQLGALFDRIRNDEQLNRRTLIVFCSDNGPEPGAGNSDPLRGHKTWLYEGGIRSPLIVWGPGLLSADAIGTTNDTAVLSAIDLNRSLYALADAPMPENQRLDGEDLSQTLLGIAQQGRQSPLFFRRPPDRPGNDERWGAGDNPDLAVRDGKWKFLINYDGSEPQLYDLARDAEEANNLIDQEPGVATKLREALLAWNATLPVDAGDPAFAADKTHASATSDDLAIQELPAEQFVNPIGEGADPWVIRDPKSDGYLWCFSDGNRAIAVHTSSRLTSLGEKHIVWQAPDSGPFAREVWAPELHLLDGRWHIYFAASDGDNANHLTYVLVSDNDDPLGNYTLHGPLQTGDVAGQPLWAIDMTVLEHAGKRYGIWSGWDEAGSDRQYLYAAEMKSPTELLLPRVKICSNDDYPWEFTEGAGRGRGLNEGPQVFKAVQRTCVIYSCGGSWLPTYKLGRLELVGSNPLEPTAWKKHDQPIFNATETTYGVGHSCFVPSPDGTQWWHVYHAKRDREPGWRRAIYAQEMQIGPAGFPRLGRPLAPGTPIQRPAGEQPLDAAELPMSSTLDRDSRIHADLTPYAHHQMLAVEADGLHLGIQPREPINAYRCGEKVILERSVPDDLRIEVTLQFMQGAESRDAGILFRSTGHSIGYDSQRGYFLGLIPRTQLMILGRMDGRNWKELARVPVQLDAAQPQRLAVEVQGTKVIGYHNGAATLEYQVNEYHHGQVGLRVVDTHVRFSDLSIKGVNHPN